MRTTPACLILAASLGSLSAQVVTPGRPEPQGPLFPRKPDLSRGNEPMRQREHSVIVQGCIRGNRLKVADASNTAVQALGASEFVLEGEKELLRQLQKEHDDHEDEIRGIAILPPVRTDGDIGTGTTKLGDKTRVTAGVQSKGSAVGEEVERGRTIPVRLRVEGLGHISDKCSVPGL